MPADLDLYDYESYDEPAEEEASTPRWPWVVGVAAIVAAIALVVSVSLLFARTETNEVATPGTATTSTPPPQDEIIVTTPPPPPPPPPTSEAPPPPPPPTSEAAATAATPAAADQRGATTTRPGACAGTGTRARTSTSTAGPARRTPAGDLLGDRNQGAV